MGKVKFYNSIEDLVSHIGTSKRRFLDRLEELWQNYKKKHPTQKEDLLKAAASVGLAFLMAIKSGDVSAAHMLTSGLDGNGMDYVASGLSELPLSPHDQEEMEDMAQFCYDVTYLMLDGEKPYPEFAPLYDHIGQHVSRKCKCFVNEELPVLVKLPVEVKLPAEVELPVEVKRSHNEDLLRQEIKYKDEIIALKNAQIESLEKEIKRIYNDYTRVCNEKQLLLQALLSQRSVIIQGDCINQGGTIFGDLKDPTYNK